MAALDKCGCALNWVKVFLRSHSDSFESAVATQFFILPEDNYIIMSVSQPRFFLMKISLFYKTKGATFKRYDPHLQAQVARPCAGSHIVPKLFKIILINT